MSETKIQRTVLGGKGMDFEKVTTFEVRGYTLEVRTNQKRNFWIGGILKEGEAVRTIAASSSLELSNLFAAWTASPKVSIEARPIFEVDGFTCEMTADRRRNLWVGAVRRNGDIVDVLAATSRTKLEDIFVEWTVGKSKHACSEGPAPITGPISTARSF